MLHFNTSNAGETVVSLLPHELLLSTLALTRPSVLLPATCGFVASALRSGDPTLKRSWRHHIIFHDYRAQDVAQHSEYWINYWHRAAQQVHSRLSIFLKARLPIKDPGTPLNEPFNFTPYALCLAPDLPLDDPLVNQDLVDCLFSSKGGTFSRYPTLTSAHIQQALTSYCFKDTTDSHLVDADDDVGDGEFPFQVGFLPHRHWALIPDAIQLAVFFLRSGNTALLRLTLIHLHNHQPVLASTTAPLYQWAALALDNRMRSRQVFQDIHYDNPTNGMSFALFLITTCVLDWSLPCLEAVTQVYNLQAPELSAWARAGTERSVVGCILDAAMRDISNSRRVVQVLRWLEHECGVQFPPMFPLCLRTDHLPVLFKLFFEFDAKSLDQVGQDDRLYLGKKIARLALAEHAPADSELGIGAVGITTTQKHHELDELVRFAFEKGMMSTSVKGECYAQSLSLEGNHQTSPWRGLLAGSTNSSEWIDVFHEAIYSTLTVSIADAAPDRIPNAAILVLLLEELSNDHGVTPTMYFEKYGKEWAYSELWPLFNVAPASEPWDFFACTCLAAEWLSPASDSLDDMPFPDDQAEMLSSLLERAILADSARVSQQLVQLTPAQLTVMIAAGAQYMVLQKNHFNGRDVGLGPGYRVPSLSTQTMLLDAWKAVGARQSDIEDERKSHRPFLTHLCIGLLQLTKDLVTKASNEGAAHLRTHIQRKTCPLEIAQGDTDLGRALAFLLECDAGFVLDHLRWNKDTPLWLWRRFPPSVVSPKIRNPGDLIECVQHAGQVGSVEDVLAIIRCAPEDWWKEATEWTRMMKESGFGS